MVYNCVTCLDMLIKAGYNMVDTYQVGEDSTKLQFEKDNSIVAAYTFNGRSNGSACIIMYCSIYGEDSWINVASTYSTGDSAIYENVETGKFLEIVCKYPAIEWMERFHAYDLERKLEVLDGGI